MAQPATPPILRSVTRPGEPGGAPALTAIRVNRVNTGAALKPLLHTSRVLEYDISIGAVHYGATPTPLPVRIFEVPEATNYLRFGPSDKGAAVLVMVDAAGMSPHLYDVGTPACRILYRSPFRVEQDGSTLEFALPVRESRVFAVCIIPPIPYTTDPAYADGGAIEVGYRPSPVETLVTALEQHGPVSE
jgi:hypothetical protein